MRIRGEMLLKAPLLNEEELFNIDEKKLTPIIKDGEKVYHAFIEDGSDSDGCIDLTLVTLTSDDIKDYEYIHPLHTDMNQPIHVIRKDNMTKERTDTKKSTYNWYQKEWYRINGCSIQINLSKPKSEDSPESITGMYIDSNQMNMSIDEAPDSWEHIYMNLNIRNKSEIKGLVDMLTKFL